MVDAAYGFNVEPTDAFQRDLIAHLRTPGPLAGPPVLAVLPETPWRTVVDVVDALKGAGQHEITFIFRGTTGVDPPPPGEPSNLDAVIAGCEPAVKFLPTIRHLPQREKLEALAGGLPDRLVECECRADLDALRRLTWLGMGRYDGDPTVEVRVDLSSHGISDQSITAASRTQWIDIYPRLIGETKARWSLEVDD